MQKVTNLLSWQRWRVWKGLRRFLNFWTSSSTFRLAGLLSHVSLEDHQPRVHGSWQFFNYLQKIDFRVCLSFRLFARLSLWLPLVIIGENENNKNTFHILLLLWLLCSTENWPLGTCSCENLWTKVWWMVCLMFFLLLPLKLNEFFESNVLNVYFQIGKKVTLCLIFLTQKLLTWSWQFEWPVKTNPKHIFSFCSIDRRRFTKFHPKDGRVSARESDRRPMVFQSTC